MKLLANLFEDVKERRIPWGALRVMAYVVNAIEEEGGAVLLTYPVLRTYCNLGNRTIRDALNGLQELDYIRRLPEAVEGMPPPYFKIGSRSGSLSYSNERYPTVTSVTPEKRPLLYSNAPEKSPQREGNGDVLADLMAASAKSLPQPLQPDAPSASISSPSKPKTNADELAPGEEYVPLDFENEF